MKQAPGPTPPVAEPVIDEPVYLDTPENADNLSSVRRPLQPM